MGDATQTGAAVDGRAVVVAVTEFPFAGVEAHAHVKGGRRWPGFSVQSTLDGSRSGHPINGADEDQEAAVTLTPRADDDPIVLFGQALD